MRRRIHTFSIPGHHREYRYDRVPRARARITFFFLKGTGTTELLEHGNQTSFDPCYCRVPHGIKPHILKRVPILAQAAGYGGAHPLKEGGRVGKGGGEREILKCQLYGEFVW